MRCLESQMGDISLSPTGVDTLFDTLTVENMPADGAQIGLI
jgi:hypothetical protein